MEKLNKPPVVVLDTNVFLVSLAPQSDYAPIFDSLVEGHFDMVVSTEILAEYEEIIGQRYDKQTVNDILSYSSTYPTSSKKNIVTAFYLLKRMQTMINFPILQLLQMPIYLSRMISISISSKKLVFRKCLR
jgi:PIN domain